MRLIRRPNGFTLIELLVVVAIIAVLAGILLPSLASSRKAARATISAVNLRSTGQILLMYTQDSKGDFPQPFRAVWPAGTNVEWREAPSAQYPGIKWGFGSALISFQTESFAVFWYSYLSEYRGAQRLTDEQFSPIDPSSYAIRKDYEALDSDTRNVTLVGSNYLYSPALFTRPDKLGFNDGKSDRLATVNINAVLQQSKKVMLWENADFNGREPQSYSSVSAKPWVMVVDGSASKVEIASIAEKAVHDGALVPLKPGIAGGPSLLPPNLPPAGPILDPDYSPGFFSATNGGYLGKDLP